MIQQPQNTARGRRKCKGFAVRTAGIKVKFYNLRKSPTCAPEETGGGAATGHSSHPSLPGGLNTNICGSAHEAVKLSFYLHNTFLEG